MNQNRLSVRDGNLSLAISQVCRWWRGRGYPARSRLPGRSSWPKYTVTSIRNISD